MSLSACAVCFISTTAFGQTRPDAGALQQHIVRDISGASVFPTPSEAAAPPPKLRSPGGVSVIVKSFNFEGATRLDEARLRAAVAAYLGRPLDFAGLQAAAAAVAKAYRDAGWIVRTYLPTQDVKRGTITIEVVEGVFGRVEVAGSGGRTSAGRVVALAAAGLRAGAPVRAAAVDRGLLLANDLPGVIATGALKAGDHPRETDLLLTLRPAPLVGGDIALDNAGERSTGRAQARAGLRFEAPLGLGEEINLDGLYSRGGAFVGGGLTAPLGRDGARAGVHASYLHYRLVTPDFAALRAHGDSSDVGLNARYLLVRARALNLYLDAGFDHRWFRNDAGGLSVSDYRVDEATAGLSGSLIDQWKGGGVTTASLILVYGDLDLTGSPSLALDQATTRAGGRFGKLNYRLGRRQTLSRTLTLSANLSGQAATKNLDTSEKFYLGGADGVRPYPTDEGAGSDGQMVNIALEERLPAGFSVAALYDWGRVRANHDNLFPGAARPNTYVLQGAGVSLVWRARRGAQVKVAYARRFGRNPDPAPNGADQDGSLIGDRVWLSAEVVF